MTTDSAHTEAASRLESQREVLAASVRRLAALVEPLGPDQLRMPAYPSEWTVADLLSHLGSGGTITRLRLDGEVDMPSIWNEWNAKEPEAQAADALRADAELEARLAALTAEDARQRRFTMGPMELDLATYLGMRINEHALHTWDLAVTVDPSATIPPDSAAQVIDSLEMMAGFAGKPTGADRVIWVRTVAPDRHFEVALRPDGVTLTRIGPVDAVDLELSGDAFIRLVYGRLDPAHTPPVKGDASDLDELRRAFPGI